MAATMHRCRGWGKSGLAAESFAVPFTEQGVVCPLATQMAHSVSEAHSDKGADNSLKAYKLGKRRWSYNQCQLVIQQEGGDEQLTVLEAQADCTDTLGDEHKESGVVYQVRLSNGQRVRVHIFVVYDRAQEFQHAAKPGEECYQWTCVQRASCKKGCEGPILRAIQRYGRLGRRSGGPEMLQEEEPTPGSKSGRQRSKSSKAAAAARSGSKEKDAELKDARFMYLSIDEASTHVGVRFFRLLTGIYTDDGLTLLGTSVSNQIRVLANNDVPTGAAFIALIVPVAHNWEGWSPAPQRSRSGRVARPSRYGSGVASPPTPSARGSPIKEHTRSQSSSDTSAPRHAMPESPELHSHARLPPLHAGSLGLGLDFGGSGLLDMHSAIGGGPSSIFAAQHVHSDIDQPLQQAQLQGVHGDTRQLQQQHHLLPPLHARGGHFSLEVGLLPPGSSRRNSGQLGSGFLGLQLQSSSPSMDTSSCRWTVSPNVHTSMNSLGRTSSGTGSFKRSRSGLGTPDGSGSPFKGTGPPSLSPSPVENPSGSPFKSGAGSGAPTPTSMRQQHQAALHAHLVQQRLAAEDAASRRGREPEQQWQPEHGGQKPQLLSRHVTGAGCSRLLPPHIHAPAGARFDGSHLHRPADQQHGFYSARSLPAHLQQMPEEHGDGMLPQIFHDTEVADSVFSQAVQHMIGSSTSPNLQAYGHPGVATPDMSEWLLAPAEQVRPPSSPSPAVSGLPCGTGGDSGHQRTVSAISLPPISSGFMAGRSASFELAITDSLLHGPARSSGEEDEKFGPFSADI